MPILASTSARGVLCFSKSASYHITSFVPLCLTSLHSCSVACNKSHRENHPPDAEPVPEPTAVLGTSQTSSRTQADPANPWSILDDCEQLQYLFKKYPGLRQQLKEINAATQPPPPQSSLQIPGLTITKGSDWSREVGIRKGLELLRKARRAPGEDGEALREYTELIVHLVYSQKAGNAVSDSLMQSRNEEERRFIQELLDAKR
jgi:zinc finger HIT domain-containing protein 3